MSAVERGDVRRLNPQGRRPGAPVNHLPAERPGQLPASMAVMRSEAFFAARAGSAPVSTAVM